ncbi:MAG: hypothetical protein RLZZ203_2400 [Cyanobacteriota bacterium]|jgi:hypothetical protein
MKRLNYVKKIIQLGNLLIQLFNHQKTSCESFHPGYPDSDEIITSYEQRIFN